jgi:hypothetical protein
MTEGALQIDLCNFAVLAAAGIRRMLLALVHTLMARCFAVSPGTSGAAGAAALGAGCSRLGGAAAQIHKYLALLLIDSGCFDAAASTQ